MIRLSFILLLLTLFSACENDNPPAEDLAGTLSEDCKEVIIHSDPASFRKDVLSFTDAYVDNNRLHLTVTYGGGCGNAFFDLVDSGAFMESNPVQANILLSFADHDNCKAIVTKELCFDLNKLATLYKEGYQTSHGTIIFRLEGWNSPIEYTF